MSKLPEPNVTSSYIFFYLNNNPKPKDIQLTLI